MEIAQIVMGVEKLWQSWKSLSVPLLIAQQGSTGNGRSLGDKRCLGFAVMCHPI